MLATTNVYSGYLQKLRRFIRRHEMLLGGEPVLVAVSGGVDSMVLLDMLLRLAPTMNLKLGVAHYEHGLRGEASKQDAQFVVEAARRHGLKVYVGHGDVKQIAEDHKLSIEEAARRARYTFLRKVARKHRFPVVVTAHSANDNAETVLLNLIRGSGVRGLAAIPPMRQMGEGVILGRPLLDFERSEIERYARELEIEWREDESNESSKFVRNRLRSELLPMLQQYNPSIIGTLNTTAEIMRNLEQYLSQSVQTAIERVIVEKSKERLALNLHQIKHYLPAMQTEIVQRGVSQAFDIPPISFNATERALALLYRETGQKTDLGAGLTALRDRDSLVVLRELPLPPELEHPFQRGEDLEVGRVRLRSAEIQRDRVQFSKNGRVEFFDADKLPESLVVRSWREGDRFRPLGMEGEKKLSDFLVDAKTPRDRKRHVLVLASDDTIVWVCGMRIDERFKVTDETTNVLRVEMQVLPPNQPSQRPEGERSGGRGGRGRGDRDERGRRSEQGGRGERGGRGEQEPQQEERPREGQRADDRHSGRRGEERRGDERPREERFGVEAPRGGGERAAEERPRGDRPRDERGRDERGREDRPRDDRGREERGRDDRSREDRPRDDRGRDDRSRDDRPREERAGEDRPREDRPRDDRREGGRRDDRRGGERPRDERGGRDERRRDGRRDNDRVERAPADDTARTGVPDERAPGAEAQREAREPRGGEQRGGRGDRREGDRREGDRREGDRREGDRRERERTGERRDDRREGDPRDADRRDNAGRSRDPREGDDAPSGRPAEGDSPTEGARERERGDRREGRGRGDRRRGDDRPRDAERQDDPERFADGGREDADRGSNPPRDHSDEPTGESARGADAERPRETERPRRERPGRGDRRDRPSPRGEAPADDDRSEAGPATPQSAEIVPFGAEPPSEVPAPAPKSRRAPAKPRRTAAEKRADAAREKDERAGDSGATGTDMPAAPESGSDEPSAPATGRARSPRAPRRTPTARTGARKKKGGSEGGEAGERPPSEE
jgi:tRNA(Ile)-lysidine synthase